MNQTQSKHYRMFLNTQMYLDEQTTIWNTIPRVVSYKNNFDELLSRISEAAEKTTGNVGVTERKNQLKKVIGIKLAQLSGVLQVFAYESKDLDLVKTVKVNASDIEKMKETDIPTTASTILKQLNKHIDQLGDFGLTQDMATELATTVEDFNQLIGRPRAILNNKYVALSTLDQLFDENNALLKNKLDKIMLMFKHTGNGFFEGYERSRVIVD